MRRILQPMVVGVGLLGMLGASATAAVADTGPWRGPSTAIAPPMPDLPDGQRALLLPYDNPKALTWQGGAALVAAYTNSEGDANAVWTTSRTSASGRFETPARLTGWLIDMDWATRPDGSAVAVGPDYCDDSFYACSLQGRVWRASTSWRSDNLSIGSAASWAMGSSPDGTATVAWVTPDDEPKAPERLRVATLGPRARSWSRAQDVGPATNARVIDLDVAPDGSSAMLIWKQTGRPCAPAPDGALRAITKIQVIARASRSARWTRPVTVSSPCLRDDARGFHVAFAAGNHGKVSVVTASARGTYSRTRPRTGLLFTPRRKVGAAATDVALASGADGVMTLAYAAKSMGLVTRTQLPHRTTWAQRHRLAASKDKVVNVDLSTGGRRGGAVLGWRQALSTTREEVHVRTKGSGNSPWTKDRALGVAPRTSFATGWVYRGTGRSSIATWFDLNDRVQVSSFG